MDPQRLLDDLDGDQRSAVTTESELVAVIAGAGSGKTRVLTRRIAYRIATGRADPRHTLALTFTREAAGELRRRLEALGSRERVEAGTFHSVALGVLRQRWHDLGKPVPTITGDRRRLVSEVVERSEMAAVTAEIDWARARAVTPERYAAAAHAAGRRPGLPAGRIAAALGDYERLKRKRGVIDLDDLLSLLVDALERDQEFADVVRWRFRHLHLDEAQDLNPVQHRLLDLLRHGRDDLFMVGDPAQSIFGFNGADPSLLVDVAHRFPGVEIVRLPTNHRSTPEIVAAGVHVLAASDQPADLVSSRADGAAVETRSCADEVAEVIAAVAFTAGADPSAGSGVAVLARTNAQLSPIADALTAAGIAVARRQGSDPALRDEVATAGASPSASRLRGWAHDVLDVPTDVLSPEAAHRRARVAVAVLDFLREQPAGDGSAFRSWVATTGPFDEPGRQGVELLTFHAAKGREWHTVVVIGVDAGLVPHSSATTPVTKAEEARLLYVAMTRATDRLVITSAARRGRKATKPCPWLDGLPVADDVIAPPPRPARPATDTTTSITALRTWRDLAARANGTTPEAVCSDRALSAIARHRPTTAAELAEVSGFGPLTAARLFAPIRRALDADAPASRDDQSARSTTTGA